VKGGFESRNEILHETNEAIFLDTTHLAQITFESLDSDKRDRSSQPIWVNSTDADSDFSNKLNAFMDHVWDGFYTGQLRMQKFVSIVDLSYDYNLYYSGTPPNKQYFVLDGAETGEGSVFKILYPNAGTFVVLDQN